MKEAVRRLARYLYIGILVSGVTGCAGISKPVGDMASDLYTIKQQFAGGTYRESLQGCLAIMAIRPACTALDQALYYAALNSLSIDPGRGGRIEAATLFPAPDKRLRRQPVSAGSRDMAGDTDIS